jgi:dihydroorotate dehydrogenase
MDFLYKKVLKPILFLFDPELIHELFVWFGELLGRFGLTRAITRFFYGYDTKRRHNTKKHGSAGSGDISNGGGISNGGDISKVVDGIMYRTPVLLAAGFDYNARLTQILPCVGFGGEEVGSVTAKPCLGNPQPRLTRLPKSQSIIVNKGLRNEGVDAVIRRLKKAGTQNNFIVGVSIARTNDDCSADVEAGIEDYAYSFRRLNEEGIGDYYTINISCPNSFGGESFTTPDLLTRLLARLSSIPCKKPVYVKMPINLPWDQFNSLLKVIDNYKLQGVVIGNLNKDYSSLLVRDEAPKQYAGGLSGLPCRKPSTELIRMTRKTYGKRFTIIGVGGIFSPADAHEKFEAGADLVQLVTGMIYEGPGLVRKLVISS